MIAIPIPLKVEKFMTSEPKNMPVLYYPTLQEI